MSSNCEEFNELLLDLAYDELDEDTSHRLHQHKDSCGECKSAFEALMGVRTVARKLTPPPIPEHFDAAILEMARKKASVFSAADSAASASVPPSTPPVARATTLWERLQGFIFKPMVLGTGLAAAAAIFAVVSLKTQSHNTMLEPMDGTPFVGAVPIEEESLLSDQAAPESKKEADVSGTGSTASAAAAVSEGSLGGGNRVQKAGPGYTPLHDSPDATPPKSRSASRRELTESEPKSNAGTASEEIRKNPADMLKRTPDASPTDPVLTPEPKASKSGASKPTPTRPSRTRKKSVSLSNKSGSADDMDGLSESSPAGGAMPPSSADEAADEAEQKKESSGSADSSAFEFESGLAAYRAGNCSSAMQHLRAFLNDGGNGNRVAVATHYIANCEKRTGRCGQAVIHFEQLFTSFPRYSERSEALFEAAGCHLKLGHDQKAKSLLEELSMDPAWRKRAEKMLQKL